MSFKQILPRLTLQKSKSSAVIKSKSGPQPQNIDFIQPLDIVDDFVKSLEGKRHEQIEKNIKKGRQEIDERKFKISLSEIFNDNKIPRRHLKFKKKLVGEGLTTDEQGKPILINKVDPDQLPAITEQPSVHVRESAPLTDRSTFQQSEAEEEEEPGLRLTRQIAAKFNDIRLSAHRDLQTTEYMHQLQ